VGRARRDDADTSAVWQLARATADIWSSPDGVNWTEATSSAAFGPRFAHQVVSDGTKLWLTAGYDAYQSAQHDATRALRVDSIDLVEIRVAIPHKVAAADFDTPLNAAL
jgi:hypothetical protein